VLNAVEAIRLRRPAVVTDDASRENEGGLILAADRATPDWIAFMMDRCRGCPSNSVPNDREAV
jgi:3,4-dihydroxy 2-butanone 4-phosphate synthase/GTP cyclohydrolase II